MSGADGLDAVSGWRPPIEAETRRRLARHLRGAEAPGGASAEPSAPPATDSPAAGLVSDLRAAAQKPGLLSSAWRGLAHPLWVRGGSGDAEALIAAMENGVAGLDLPFQPRRIMEIGLPFFAIALVSAFPEAAIASIAPIPGDARLHSLNTLPWRQISGIHHAIGPEGMRLSESTDPETGADRLVPDPQGRLSAVSLDRVFKALGWTEADLLLVDASLCPAFADPAAGDAFTRFRRIVVRASGRGIAEADLAARFPAATHRIVQRGGDVTIDRLAPGVWYPRQPIPVFDLAGERLDAVLPAATCYAPIGDTGFRLRPARGRGRTTRLTVTRFIAGLDRFECGLRMPPNPGPPLACAIGFVASETNRTIHRAEIELHAAEAHHWRFDLPAFFGEMRIEFEVAPTAEGEPGWLEIRDPRLL